ncbi:unnamed protein product [Schistosoma mattheei]|uniref:Uncharacterized protein n=1 Tax=Schistosoma mattheei TaxID=31246 RepID=A0A3P8DQX5_9TREM|nr:unnamed protein product [Schistosoma mattheei]
MCTSKFIRCPTCYWFTNKLSTHYYKCTYHKYSCCI